MLHIKYLLPLPSVPGIGKTHMKKIPKFAHDYTATSSFSDQQLGRKKQ
jgi:hypothetical protein